MVNCPISLIDPVNFSDIWILVCTISIIFVVRLNYSFTKNAICLLYTSDAADDLLCVALGGRRIIKKTNNLDLGIKHDWK